MKVKQEMFSRASYGKVCVLKSSLKIENKTTNRFSPGDKYQLTCFQDIWQTKEVMFSYESKKNWVQLDPANSNSVISNSPLFRTQHLFPWINPSVIYYPLFQTPAISNYFSLPLRVWNSEVQLYLEKISTSLKQYNKKQM